MDETQYAILSNPQNVKAIKTILDQEQAFDKRQGIVLARLLTGIDDGRMAIFLNSNWNSEKQRQLCSSIPDLELKPFPRRNELSCTTDEGSFDDYLKSCNLSHLKIPRRYCIFHPMVLYSSGSFQSNGWKLLPDHIFQTLLAKIALKLGVSHIAVNAPIHPSDELRKPSSILLLYGDFGSDIGDKIPTDADFKSAFWVHCFQNKIYQTWAPRYTMFSRGNISEKKRILEFPNVLGSTIVDMYAGIGYFTFSYAKAGAKRIYCWELNPWSIEGLIRGAKMNQWSIQLVKEGQEFIDEGALIVVFAESNVNAVKRLEKINTDISHVNLGILPSSKSIWPQVVHMRLHTPSYIHAHDICSSSQSAMYMDEASVTFSHLINRPFNTHWSSIKSFAPGVMHVVLDFHLV